jgi:hypothetical protein
MFCVIIRRQNLIKLSSSRLASHDTDQRRTYRALKYRTGDLSSCQRYGCNPDALLKDAGIDADSLQQPDSRISLNQHQKLWKLAIERSQRPCIGLDIGEAISPGTIHGLGLGWLVSDTLKSALERLIRFQRLVSTNADIMLHETSETYELIYQAKKITPDFQTASADALLIATTRLCRLALSEQITPQKVELPHDDTDCASAYQNFFNCTSRLGLTDGLLRSIKIYLSAICPTPTHCWRESPMNPLPNIWPDTSLLIL